KKRQREDLYFDPPPPLRNQQIEQSVTFQERIKWLDFHGLGGVNIQQKNAESKKKPPVISHFAMARHISQ
ncbi:MAG: hypothetical protein K0B08_11365, partial [Bacteroidales bacterium]|nr:hypothetical protein [Bacteroidales bacterium]